MSLGWVETNQPPVQPGSNVCIAAQILCFWQRNPLQIVYVTEDQKSEQGLLQRNAHAESSTHQRGRGLMHPQILGLNQHFSRLHCAMLLILPVHASTLKFLSLEKQAHKG